MLYMMHNWLVKTDNFVVLYKWERKGHFNSFYRSMVQFLDHKVKLSTK